MTRFKSKIAFTNSFLRNLTGWKSETLLNSLKGIRPAIGKDSSSDKISPRAEPQTEQKQRLYLYGGVASKVDILSRPCMIWSELDLTNAMALAPTFLQRVQWHVPNMLGGSLSSNWTVPQQQLPLIIFIFPLVGITPLSFAFWLKWSFGVKWRSHPKTERRPKRQMDKFVRRSLTQHFCMNFLLYLSIL